MSLRSVALHANMQPRQIARAAAAEYVGVSATKFDQMVKDGRMPHPRCVDARRLWDVRQLDLAIDALPIDGVERETEIDNPFDTVPPA